MHAGFGKSILTPPPGTELAGYGYYLNRKALSVHDDLYARALAIEQDGTRYCLISCDLLGLSADVAAQVRQHLNASHSCPAAQVLLVCVHTHCGPTVKHHEGTGEIDPQYLQTVAPALCAACDAAFASLAAVNSLRMSMDCAQPQLCYNRTSAQAAVDNQVRALFIGRDGAPDIALVSYACHAVSRGRAASVSADYPGQVCAALSANGVQAIFVNGVCGDIDPTPPHGGDLAERLAQSILCALDAPRQALPLSVCGGAVRQTLYLAPVSAAHIRQAAEHAAAQEDIPGGGKVARLWEASMLARLDALPTQEEFTVRWLRLGGIPIIALPFEAFTDTGLRIRAALGDPRAMVLGCADEILGYLPTREDIGKSAYAALESTFLYKRLPVRTGEAERIGEALGEALASP